MRLRLGVALLVVCVATLGTARVASVHWRLGPYYVTDGYAASAKIVPSATAARGATIKEVNREHHNLGLTRKAVRTGVAPKGRYLA
jgi:hypothetical protein